jgi:hypothetical protein
MKNSTVTAGILAGRDVDMVIAGKEVDIGTLKYMLQKIHNSVRFGGSQSVPQGRSQVVHIPASGVEGVRYSLVSALDQSPVDVQLQQPQHHENPPTQ